MYNICVCCISRVECSSFQLLQRIVWRMRRASAIAKEKTCLASWGKAEWTPRNSVVFLLLSHSWVSYTGRRDKPRERRITKERRIRSCKVVFIERTRSSGRIGSLHSSCLGMEYPLAATGSHRDKIRANNENRRLWRLRFLAASLRFH